MPKKNQTDLLIPQSKVSIAAGEFSRSYRRIDEFRSAVAGGKLYVYGGAQPAVSLLFNGGNNPIVSGVWISPLARRVGRHWPTGPKLQGLARSRRRACRACRRFHGAANAEAKEQDLRSQTSWRSTEPQNDAWTDLAHRCPEPSSSLRRGPASTTTVYVVPAVGDCPGKNDEKRLVLDRHGRWT